MTEPEDEQNEELRQNNSLALGTLSLNRPDSFSSNAPRTQRFQLVKLLAFLIFGIVLGGFGAWLIYAAPDSMSDQQANQISDMDARAEDDSGGIGGNLVASGFVVAGLESTVAAQVTGRISQLYFTPGQAVARGQVLARIDDRIALADLATAKANVASAIATRSSLSADLSQAQSELERSRQLVDKGFVSKADIEERERRVGSLSAQILRAVADIAATRSLEQRARVILDQHIVRAPFSGLVIDKNAQLGEIISPLSAGGGFTRTGICTLIDPTSLEVVVDVGEATISKISMGQQVWIELSSQPDHVYKGRVSRIVPSASRDKATVQVHVSFDQMDQLVIPEIAAKVSFIDKGPDNG